MKALLALLFALTLLGLPSASAEEKQASKPETFYAFFHKKEKITYAELIKAVGKPSSRTPLYTYQEADDYEDDHAWLHYQVNDEVLISVTCVKGVLGYVQMTTNGLTEMLWVSKKAPEFKP